ncbi:MAG: hypothetical protein HY735_11665 [Verrucomicrobia bacterium]|nr:hypothetical protein [Verrucomicrobiota bacterium]
MRSGFTQDVFLSHSAKDKAVVPSLVERLRQDGPLPKAERRRQKLDFSLQPLAFRLRAFLCDPLNHQCRFIPLRSDDAPIKGSLAQFLYINWRPVGHLTADCYVGKLLAVNAGSSLQDGCV